jgi:hypothetical protein
MKKWLQKWLEIVPYTVSVSPCQHKWEVLETTRDKIFYQLPPEQVGYFTLPSRDMNTYSKLVTTYIMQCKHCGELKKETL